MTECLIVVAIDCIHFQKSYQVGVCGVTLGVLYVKTFEQHRIRKL